MSRVEFWLHSIKSRARFANVFIVGTHLDKVSKEHAANVLKNLQNKYSEALPTLRIFTASVSCSTGEGVVKLRKYVAKKIKIFTFHNNNNNPSK